MGQSIVIDLNPKGKDLILDVGMAELSFMLYGSSARLHPALNLSSSRNMFTELTISSFDYNIPSCLSLS